MTEKEINEIRSRYLAKQILKPQERLTVVFNFENDKKEKVFSPSYNS